MRPTTARRIAGSFLASSVVAAALAGCGGSGSTSSQAASAKSSGGIAKSSGGIKVTMNTEPVAVTDVWPQIFAYYDGLFTKYGLDVSQQTLSGAGAASAEAVQAGQLNFGIGAAEFTGVDAAGGDLEAVMTDVQHYAFALVAKPSIKSLAQLKGGSLAVAGATGSFAVAAALLFKQTGIPQSSIREVNVSSIPNVLPAVEKGAADAGLVIYGASTLQAAAAGLNTIASTATQITEPVPAAGVVVSKKFAKGNPTAVQDYVDASEDAIKLMMGNEALTVSIMQKASGGSVPVADLQHAWSYYQAHVWTLNTAPTVAEYNSILPTLTSFDSATGKLKASQLVDDQFADKAEAAVKS